MRRACRLAGLAHFVEGLPQGSRRLSSERGVRLSGGQIQRTWASAGALARMRPCWSWMRRPSALDDATEANIIEAVRRLGRRYTVPHDCASDDHRCANATSSYKLNSGRACRERVAPGGVRCASAKDQTRTDRTGVRNDTEESLLIEWGLRTRITNGLKWAVRADAHLSANKYLRSGWLQRPMEGRVERQASGNHFVFPTVPGPGFADVPHHPATRWSRQGSFDRHSASGSPLIRSRPSRCPVSARAPRKMPVDWLIIAWALVPNLISLTALYAPEPCSA